MALITGCASQKVSYKTFKREYKENRFSEEFRKADSLFNQKFNQK